MLQANTIKAARGAKHRQKRVGRGNASGHGTMSTRGGKGQTARSGGSKGLKLKGFKRLLQSTPKLRGFTSPMVKPTEIYLAELDRHFAAGDTVTVVALQEKHLVSKNAMHVKVLATGSITKKVTLSGITCTKGAAEKIKAAGGEVK